VRNTTIYYVTKLEFINVAPDGTQIVTSVL